MTRVLIHLLLLFSLIGPAMWEYRDFWQSFLAAKRTTSQILHTPVQQLQSKFKHAADFGFKATIMLPMGRRSDEQSTSTSTLLVFR